jgi:hypothetical protein
MKPTITKPTQADLAAKWGTSTRTMRRWVAAGAPVNDEQAMHVWIASRKHTPKGTADMLTGQPATGDKATVQTTTATARDPKQGAAAALQRLEVEEKDAFDRLQLALGEGRNALEVKLLREHWLKTGDSLRRYDLLVEQNRRDSGELVPRATVEELLANLSLRLRFAIIRMGNDLPGRLMQMANQPGDVKDLLVSMLRDVFFTSAHVGFHNAPLPDWMRKPLLLHAEFGDEAFMDEQGAVRIKAFDLLLGQLLQFHQDNYEHE